MPNEDKATRYQRLRRRATVASVLAVGLTLGLAHVAGPPAWAIAAPGAGPAAHLARLTLGVVPLLLLAVAIRLPAAIHRDVILTRRYGLLRGRPADWLRDWLRHAAVHVVAGTLAVLVCAGLRWGLPQAWWAVAALLAAAAPAGIGHALRSAASASAGTPLARAELRERLTRLLATAGYPTLGIYQTHVGEQTRLANAAVVTVGGRRRVEITDTLLADHTDEEVEVVVAHELAHVAHHDDVLMQVMTALQTGASLWAAEAVLQAAGVPAGVLPAAALPLALAAVGAAFLLVRPFGLALSRQQERRADEYALTLTRNAPALASVVRRMAATNVAEPAPSAWTLWWWHSHPSVEARIRRATAPQD